MTVVEPAAPTAASLLAPAPPPAARRLRWVPWSGLAVAFAVTALARGLPTDRVVLLGWVVAGLAVHAAVDGWRRLGRLMADWLPLAAVLLVYDASRGLADGAGMPVHVGDIAAVDRWLGGGQLPTVELQQALDSRVWEAVATLVYSSHFVVTPLVLAVLWLRDRPRWARYARMVVALSLAGLATYVVFPAAPPWLAAREGVIEPVERISSTGWAVLGLPKAGAVLAQSQEQVNLVAAVPSLHTAFAVLACLFFLPSTRRAWVRVLLVLYPSVMILVLVWSGEHYVIDTLLGALYAAAVLLVLRRRPGAPAAAS